MVKHTSVVHAGSVLALLLAAPLAAQPPSGAGAAWRSRILPAPESLAVLPGRLALESTFTFASWRNYGAGGDNVIWYMDGVKWMGNGWLPAVTDINWRIENH